MVQEWFRSLVSGWTRLNLADVTFMAPAGASPFKLSTFPFRCFREEVFFFFFLYFPCEYLFVGRMCPSGNVLPEKTEYHWLPTYSPLDSVKMCHGLYSKVYYHWTQGSAALCMGSKSLVSFVSFFSLCCFLTCIPACRHAWLPQLFCFDSTNISYNWPPLSVCLSVCLSLSPTVSLSPCLFLSPHSFLSMSNYSKTLVSSLCPFWMCSCLKNSIPLVSWFPFFAFWLIRHRPLPSVLWNTTTVLTIKK